MTDTHRFRLLDHTGMATAWSEGRDRATALSTIMHYAFVYGRDGPVTVQERINKRWKPVDLEQETEA